MIRTFGRHRVLTALFGASFALVLGGWTWAALALRGIGEPLIMHWSDYTGITRIGGSWDISAIGMFGTVIVLADAVLAFSLEDREPTLGRTAAAAGVFLAVLLFILFALIITAN